MQDVEGGLVNYVKYILHSIGIINNLKYLNNVQNLNNRLGCLKISLTFHIVL